MWQKQQHDRSNRDPSKAASLKNLSKENPEGKTLDKEKRVQPSPGTPIMDNTIAWNLPLVKQQTRLGRHLLELESNQLQPHRRENNVNNLTRGRSLLLEQSIIPFQPNVVGSSSNNNPGDNTDDCFTLR
ncbi:hypothetical protein Tco_1131357 [Tanacetum coccineum]